jgi:uncharacterized protein (DUF433 family)
MDDINMDHEGRIVSNPDICRGRPIIRGTRIMVWLILEYLANGDSVDELLAAYPTITRQDISACLAYASRAAPVEIAAHEL